MTACPNFYLLLALSAASFPTHLMAQDVATVNTAPAEQALADTQLQEIVVTAQRRSENLQRAPLQINVVTGDALARSGSTEVRDLQTLVPGLNIQQAGVYTQFTVRGVGSVVTTPFGDPAVAFNVDDVYIARPTGSHGTFYDLERVEVLKGPQGTLYGRNATAGAVNVITAAPKFDDSFGANVRYGSYNQVVADGFANLKLGDTVAIRAAGQIANRDGYYKDGYDDEDSKAGRLQLLFKPSDTLSLVLGGDYAAERGKGSGVVPYPYPGGDPWAGPSSAVVRDFVATNLKVPYSLITPAGRTNLVNFEGFGRVHNDNWGFHGRLDWDLGFGKLSTIASYRVSSVHSIGYPGAFAFAPDVTSRQHSFETRLASNGSSPLTWLVGLYYYKESQRGTQATDFVDNSDPLHPFFGTILTFAPITDETYAAFTQETLAITPRLRLTGGIRYFSEIKTSEGSTKSVSPFPPVLGSATIANSGRLSWSKANFRAGVDYDLGEQSLVYAAVANGFKAGGFYSGAAPSAVNPTPNSYAPEALTSYTFGTKNRFFGQRLQLNAEIFYWDYKNRQYINFGPVNTGTAANLAGAITINVGSSHVQGADFDVSYLFSRNTLFSAVVEYIDEAKNDLFVFPSTSAPGNGCTAPSSGTVDCSGTPMPFVPRWSATLGFRQTFNLANDAQVTFNAKSKIESRRLLGIEQLANQYQGGYTRTDLDLSYHAQHDLWSVGVFVTNLEDRVTRTAGLISPITGSPWGDLLPPRTYGVRASLRF